MLSSNRIKKLLEVKMAEKMGIYKCEICGNIVEVLHAGMGVLVCCGQNMTLLPEKVTEQGNEKHLPVIEQNGNEYHIKVGEIQHPMLDEHHIEWIDAVTEKEVLRKFLKAGEVPEMVFSTKYKLIKVREHCNIHGLWAEII